MVAATTDWLLEEVPRELPAIAARRDSVTRGLDELLPRPRTMQAQAGFNTGALGEPVPLRHAMWPYLATLGALVVEWVARRRRGMR